MRGEQGLVLWLLRPTAQQGLERQGQVGLGRVGPRLAEGVRADGGHRTGADLTPEVSLSVESSAALLISPSLIFSSVKCCLEGQSGGHRIIMG